MTSVFRIHSKGITNSKVEVGIVNYCSDKGYESKKKIFEQICSRMELHQFFTVMLKKANKTPKRGH